MAGRNNVVASLMQPLFGVRMSPALDQMECVVMLACLHHSGVLDSVLRVDKDRFSLSLAATTKSAAAAARAIRRHVQQLRDLANQALREDEDPPLWSSFTAPVVDKCALLLRVPPMTKTEASTQSKTVLAAQAFAEAGAGRSKSAGGAIAAALRQSKLVKSPSLSAHAVYRRMWAQGLGTGRSTKVLSTVQGFLKAEVDAKQVLAMLERQRLRALELEEAFDGLLVMTTSPAEGVAEQALRILGSAESGGKHYLEDLVGVGVEQKAALRQRFLSLCNVLVDILQAGHATGTAIKNASRALTVKLDREDLSQLLRSRLLDALGVRQNQGSGPQVWSVHDMDDGADAKVASASEDDADDDGNDKVKSVDKPCAAIHDLVQLLRSIIMQVGVYAPALETGEVVRALQSAFDLTADAFDSGALASPVQVGSDEWDAQGQRWCGLAKFDQDTPSPLWLNLKAPRHPLTVQPSLSGTATWMGRGYAVSGSYKPCKASDSAKGGDVDVALTMETAGGERLGLKGAIERPNEDVEMWGMSLSYETADGISEFGLHKLSGEGIQLRVCAGKVNGAIEGGAVCLPDDENAAPVIVQAMQPVSPENNYLEVEITGFELLLMSPSGIDSLDIGLAAEGFAGDSSLGLGEGTESIRFAFDAKEVRWGTLESVEIDARSPIFRTMVFGCRVHFDGDIATKVEWSRNGETVGEQRLHKVNKLDGDDREQEECPTLTAGPMFMTVVLRSEQGRGYPHVLIRSQPAQLTREREKASRTAVEDVMATLRTVGHSAVLKRELARAEWRELLWKVISAAEVAASIRRNALQVLTLSLIQNDAMEAEQAGADVDRLLSLLVRISPEGALLNDEDGFGDAEACLPLRLDVCTLLQQLLVTPHSQEALREKISNALASLEGERISAAGLAAVLMLGGILDQAWPLGPSESENALGCGVIEALVSACRRAMQCSAGSTLAQTMLRSRLLKALWAVALTNSAKRLIGSDDDLVEAIVTSAEDRALAPIKCALGISSRGSSQLAWAGKYADDTGMIATLDGEASCCMSKPMSSGKHYMEVQFLDGNPGYFLVGVAVESFQADEKQLGYSEGSWAWSSDGDFMNCGSWSCEVMSGTNTSFNPEENIGVLFDADTLEVTFYQNGNRVGACSPATTSTWEEHGARNGPLQIGACISGGGGRVRLVPPDKMKFAEGASYYETASEPKGATGPWVTMEMLAAKAMTMCEESSVQAVALQPMTSPTSKGVVGRARASPLQQRVDVDFASAKHWLLGRGQSDEDLVFPDEKQRLLDPLPTRSSDQAEEGKRSKVDTSPWKTNAEPSERGRLLGQTEMALGINFCRLIVLQLLEAKQSSFIALVGPQRLLSLAAPFFPPGADDERPLFLAGPFAASAKLLDAAYLGWAEQRKATAAEDLNALSSACLNALRREIMAASLEGSGVSSLSAWPQLPIAASPSMVTWTQPTPVPVRPAIPDREGECADEMGLGLAVWLSRHLLEDYGLSKHSECHRSLGQLASGLIETLATLSTGQARKQLQDTMSAVIPNCEAAKGWAYQSHFALHTLRVQMLRQLKKESSDNREGKLSYTPLLQSLAATVIASDLAIYGDDETAILKGFRAAMDDTPAAALADTEQQLPFATTGGADDSNSSQPIGNLASSVVEQLEVLGFAPSKIELASRVLNRPSVGSLETIEGQQLLEKLGANDESELQAQLTGSAEVYDEDSDRGEGFMKFKALLVVTRALRCMLHRTRLPTALVEMCNKADDDGDGNTTAAWAAALDVRWSLELDTQIVEYAVAYGAKIQEEDILGLEGSVLFPNREEQDDGEAPNGAEGGLKLDNTPARRLPSLRRGERVRRATAQKEPTGPTLGSTGAPVLRARWEVLRALNRMVERSLELVDLSQFEADGAVAHMLAFCKGLLLPQVKTPLFVACIQASSGGESIPDVTLNRGTKPAESRKKQRTLAWQLMESLDKAGQNLTKVNDSSMAWCVRFEGEGGIDAGGLFRESLREMCAELQSRDGALRVLLPCPNQRMAVGSCQDKWLPNPRLGGAEGRRLLRFVGQLLGQSVRSNACIELDLPGLVWKQLVGEEGDREDVAAVDEAWSKELAATEAVASVEEWQQGAHTWVVKSFTGRTVVLIAGGAERRVAWEERQAWIDAQVRWRVEECKHQVAAMMEGFFSVIPKYPLPLMTWRELEKRVCGSPIIDVDLLQSNAEYEVPSSDPVIVRFWNVVKAFSQSDLAALIAFAWGRRRMPVPNSGDHLKIDVLSGRGDDYLPSAHTCFFTIDMPAYSSEAALRTKLLYAIHQCAAIDCESTHPSGTLYDSEDDEDDDSEKEEENATELDPLAALDGGGLLSGAGQWLRVPLDGGETESNRLDEDGEEEEEDATCPDSDGSSSS